MYACERCRTGEWAVRRIAERDDAPACRQCRAPMQRRITSTMLAMPFKPYRTVAVDKEQGTPLVIRSGAEHRAFLARNGYEEVGNDRSMAPPAPEEVRQRTLEQQEIDDITFDFETSTHEASK